MKRPAGDHDNSLEDIKNDSEKRPRMEQDHIGRHQSYPFRPAARPFIPPDGNGVARSRPSTPPIQHYGFPNHANDTVYGMDALMPKTINNLRNHPPPSPATSYASTSVSEDVFSVTNSNLDSPPQSPITSSTGFDEECLSTRPRSLFAERTSHSHLSISTETYSESPFCSLSPENSLLEPNFTSALAEKTTLPSDMDILFSIKPSEIKPNAVVRFEQQPLAVENTLLPNRQERTRCWLMSSYTPYMSHHGSLETFPSYQTDATETIWQDTFRSHIDYDPILPEVDVQKPSASQTLYTAMEIEPCNFGLNSSTIASLPECIRVRIMTFCTEPKDLISMINSSPVFLQPFCLNRRAIVSQITRSMRFRFGGDMPHSCLMVARLRNMESKGDAGSPEVLNANAKRAIKGILRLTPRGPLLHPFYSLRLLKLISDTLDKAESLMTGYAHQAWVNKLGPSNPATDLVLSRNERKRFMDAICLYDAYCTAFFSENAISSDDDTALRQSFLEEDGIPGEIIKRFYSITAYLHYSYQYWIRIAIKKRHHDLTAKGENPSLFLYSAKHIDQLVNHFVCSGPTVFRMLQDNRAPERYDFLLKLLYRCETDAAYLQKITSAHGRGDKRLWAYTEIAAGLTRQEVQRAQHFWDPVLVGNIKPVSSIWPMAGLQLRSRPDA